MMHNRENEQENVADSGKQIEENARQAAAQFASITPSKLRFCKNKTLKADATSNSQRDHNYPKSDEMAPLHVSATDVGRVSNNNINTNAISKSNVPLINNEKNIKSSNNFCNSTFEGKPFNTPSSVKYSENSNIVLVNAISNVLDGGKRVEASSFPSFSPTLSKKKSNDSQYHEINEEKMDESSSDNVSFSGNTVNLNDPVHGVDSFDRERNLRNDEKSNASSIYEYETTVSEENIENCTMSNCQNCENIQKEFDDWKKTMIANFQIMKLKVMRTDELITEHHNNYSNLESEKKTVKDLKVRLENCYGETGALRIQLKKAQQANEPLKKTVRRFEYEKSMKQQIIDDLKRKLDCSELEVGRLRDNGNSSQSLQDNLRKTIEDNLKEHAKDKKKIIQQAKMIDKLTSSLAASRKKQKEDTKALKKALKDNEKLLSKTLAQQSKILKRKMNLKNISPGKASKKSPIGVLSPSPSPPPTSIPRRKRRAKKKRIDNDLDDFFNEAFANTDILSTTTENDTDDEMNELPKLLTSYSIPTLLSPPLSPIPPSPVLDFVENLYETNFPGPSSKLTENHEEEKVDSVEEKSKENNLNNSKSSCTTTNLLDNDISSDSTSESEDALTLQTLDNSVGTEKGKSLQTEDKPVKRKKPILSKRSSGKTKLSKFKSSNSGSSNNTTDSSDNEVDYVSKDKPEITEEEKSGLANHEETPNDSTLSVSHPETVQCEIEDTPLIAPREEMPSDIEKGKVFKHITSSNFDKVKTSEPPKTSLSDGMTNEVETGISVNASKPTLDDHNVDSCLSQQANVEEKDSYKLSVPSETNLDLNEVPCSSRVSTSNVSSPNKAETESSTNKPTVKNSMSLDLELNNSKSEQSTAIVESNELSAEVKGKLKNSIAISLQVAEHTNTGISETGDTLQQSQPIVDSDPVQVSTESLKIANDLSSNERSDNSLQPDESVKTVKFSSLVADVKEDTAGPSTSDESSLSKGIRSRSHKVDELDSEVASFRLPIQSSLSMDTDESSNQSAEDLPMPSSSFNEDNVDTSELRTQSQVSLPIDIDESSNLSANNLPVSSSSTTEQDNEINSNSPEPLNDSSLTSSPTTSSSCNCSVSTTVHSMLWSHPARARQILGRRYTSFSSGVTTIPTFISPRLRIERTRSLSPTMFSPPSPPLSPIPPSPRRSILTPIISPLPTTPLPESISPLPPSPKITSPPLIRGSALLRTDDPSVFAPKPVSHNTSTAVKVLKFTMENNRNNFNLQRNDLRPARRFDQSRVRARSCSPTFSTKKVRNSLFDRSPGSKSGGLSENRSPNNNSSFSAISCNLHSSIKKVTCYPYKSGTPKNDSSTASTTKINKQSDSEDDLLTSNLNAEKLSDISDTSNKSSKCSEISVSQQGDACELIRPTSQTKSYDSAYTIEQRIKSLKNNSNATSIRRNINMSVDSNNPEFNVNHLENHLELDIKKKNNSTYSSSTITRPVLKNNDISETKTNSFDLKESSSSATSKPLSEVVDDFKACSTSAFISKGTSDSKLCSSINVSSTNVWQRLNANNNLSLSKSKPDLQTNDESSDDDCLHIASDECFGQDENASGHVDTFIRNENNEVNSAVSLKEDVPLSSTDVAKPECIETKPEDISQDVSCGNDHVIDSELGQKAHDTDTICTEMKRKRKSSFDSVDIDFKKPNTNSKENNGEKNQMSTKVACSNALRKEMDEVEEGEIPDDDTVQKNQNYLSENLEESADSSKKVDDLHSIYQKTQKDRIFQREQKTSKGVFIKRLFLAIKKKSVPKCEVVEALSKPENLSTLHQLSSRFILAVKSCNETLLPTILKSLENLDPCSLPTSSNSKQSFDKCHPQAQYIPIPVLTSFERDLLSVIFSVLRIRNFPNPVQKILNDLQKEIMMDKFLLCDRLALCRMFAAICRQYKKIDKLIEFIYSLAFDQIKDIQFPAVFITCYSVWPAFLSRTNLILQKNESQLDLVRIKLSPLSSTLQFIALAESFESKETISQEILQKIMSFNWCDNFSIHELYKQFIHELLALISCKQLSFFENNSNNNCIEICSFAMSTIKAIELLSKRVGWEWTYNFIIHESVINHIKTFFAGSNSLHPDNLGILIRLSGDLCRYGIQLKIDLKPYCKLLVDILEKVVDSNITLNQVEVSIVYTLLVLAPTYIDVSYGALKKWVANARQRGIVVPQDLFRIISDIIV